MNEETTLNDSKQEMQFAAIFNMIAISSLFFLSVASYYQIKPASRTLAITVLGSTNLPYLWIGSAIALLLLLPIFAWRAKRFTPTKIVSSTSICLIISLIIFYFLLSNPTPTTTIAFYILSDVYGVVLIEECWGWTSSRMKANRNKPWYGIVGSGALLGGMVGSILATALLAQNWIPFNTVDLLLVAAGLLCFLLLLLYVISKFSIDAKEEEEKGSNDNDYLLQDTAPKRKAPPKVYLVYITSLILVAQLIEPIIEYQFMNKIEASITGLDERTKYLSGFFTLLSIGALFVNLTVFPLIYRTLGIAGGLMAQPVMIIAGSFLFLTSANLQSGAILKFLDRGLSYSINRSSKELLYLPLKVSSVYKAKSWIDMFGYRLFKVISSVGIIAATKWYSGLTLADFSYAVIILAIIWLTFIPQLVRVYGQLTK
jgi:AAA family ATP:ADP antiporter